MKGKKTNRPGIFEYELEGKKYFYVRVAMRNKLGKLVARKETFKGKGERITSLKVAESVKFDLRKQLEESCDKITDYTWAQWHSKFLKSIKRQYSNSLYQDYSGRLSKWMNPAWNRKKIEDFTKDDVEDLIFDYLPEKGATDWTKRNIWKRVHRIFESAVEEGVIARNPARGIKVNALSDGGKVLNSKEIDVLLTKAKALGHEYYPIWVTAVLSGMRNGELFALQWSQIDLENDLINVNQQFTNKDGIHLPKRGKKRIIELQEDLKDFLLKYRKVHGSHSQSVWRWVDARGAEGKVSKKKEFFKMEDLVLPRIRSWQMGMQATELKSFCERIGITKIEFHDLRATHITHLLANETAVGKVMKHVGHSKLSTTDGYNRLTGVDIKGVTKNLGIKVPQQSEDKEAVSNNVVNLFEKRTSS